MQPLFTVFTPTYNRASLIHRVFDSLMNQSHKSFEWLIIDDGSSDNTKAIIEEFSTKASFPIQYIWQENQGKVAAINRALDLASGFFFLVFDSDDWCVSNALQIFADEWEKLPEAERNIYTGISCLKALPTGELVGERYSDRLPKYGSSYVERFNRHVRGDKWELIRTDLHRINRYDLVAPERYMAPEYAWLRMGLDYRTVFLDEILSIVEYQADGISRNNVRHRAKSPLSAMKFYRLALLCAGNWRMKIRSKVNLARFYFHATKKSTTLDLCSGWLIVGFLFYLRDCFGMRNKKGI